MRSLSWQSVLCWSFFALVPSEGSAGDITQHPSWMLLEHDDCGSATTDRIVGGKNASLGAYPWIARIGYNKYPSKRYKDLTYRCGGSLINKLYVVTAAHCVTNLPGSYKVQGVRLGEHNTETNPDCDNGYCGEPVQDFFPEQIVVHKNYNNPQFMNDIAIIRLNQPVVYNDFVKPICMVRDELLVKDYMGELAEVAGWGIYDINKPKPSPILQTIKLPVVDMQRCHQAFKNYAKVGNQQLCVGGIPGADSCGGDSGGPLMKVEALDGPPRYFFIGVVSFGSKHCGETSTPAIYSKISAYLPWILDNVSP